MKSGDLVTNPMRCFLYPSEDTKISWFIAWFIERPNQFLAMVIALRDYESLSANWTAKSARVVLLTPRGIWFGTVTCKRSRHCARRELS